MRRFILMCVSASVIGGLTAFIWFGVISRQATSNAQEPAPMPAPRMQASQPGIPTANVPAAPYVAPPVNAPADGGGPDDEVNPNVWQELTSEERVNVSVYRAVNRSVVNINTKGVQTDRFMLFETPTEGEGSGSVIDKQGHILTNFHVVDGAREVQVTLFDGKAYDAKLVGVDPETDMAVLLIDAPTDSLFPVTFGSSSNLLVGQRVFAIGNPFGLERTLTTGIISSLNRTLPARKAQRTIKSIIQIDAAINPGNSGGPLLDSHGRMIGMNTAIASKTGESAGVGFAIPVNTIIRVASQLIQNGRVRRPESGIEQVLNTNRGVLILSLTTGGPAEKAGLRGPKIQVQQKRQGPIVFETRSIDRAAADLIVAADGKPVRTADDLLSAIDNKRPGEEIMLTVVRQGQQTQVALRLGGDK